ncbi:NO-inducible flavohemoprotein [Chengkuizengella axinellae]|uniref:Flavohemoprotein n=1 Tax=Chengkuizengella axinellae TaxID=3064388 RepID=A0ABT9IUJ7_9BACL|nr:NO-inducible flavohemoprotein [Chengkuizengella sp. 2205SS18-9]MDP5272982.1 NO-inducible flavohemoprotein [Chengkuizengella sp. 2205SS18-9]
MNQETIKIIKSTVPVLQERGEEITSVFYKLMFGNHPELLNIFNHANQKQGRQQKALAGSVYAAAANIDNLETILPVVKAIAHKHRSLGIKPEQYPIVGKHLLLAIKEVLGDAATDEIMKAWEEAYGIIADVFISVEQEMYQEAETANGGWKDFRNFVIDKKVEESKVITSFYLRPEDGKQISSFQPGQYISIKMDDIEGQKNSHIRQYSLSDSPDKSVYRISVKKEAGFEDRPDGVVSSYLHDHVNEGDVVKISAPAGDFVLNTNHDLPIVLISGGVGLTPMISMLNHLVEKEPTRPVYFVHAAINSEYHAFRNHVQQLAAKHDQVKSLVCYQSPTEQDKQSSEFEKEGFIEMEWLKSILPSHEADFYFCGPVPFMKVIYKGLKDWGVNAEDIHYEFFGPKDEIEE